VPLLPPGSAPPTILLPVLFVPVAPTDDTRDSGQGDFPQRSSLLDHDAFIIQAESSTA
jgi:hypothetical protein